MNKNMKLTLLTILLTSAIACEVEHVDTNTESSAMHREDTVVSTIGTARALTPAVAMLFQWIRSGDITEVDAEKTAFQFVAKFADSTQLRAEILVLKVGYRTEKHTLTEEQQNVATMLIRGVDIAYSSAVMVSDKYAVGAKEVFEWASYDLHRVCLSGKVGEHVPYFRWEPFVTSPMYATLDALFHTYGTEPQLTDCWERIAFDFRIATASKDIDALEFGKDDERTASLVNLK